jgi:hypothetical protein
MNTLPVPEPFVSVTEVGESGAMRFALWAPSPPISLERGEMV